MLIVADAIRSLAGSRECLRRVVDWAQLSIAALFFIRRRYTRLSERRQVSIATVLSFDTFPYGLYHPCSDIVPTRDGSGTDVKIAGAKLRSNSFR